ncbi:unnamed protein product [Wuchereria bancrofti]|uniref:Uncharacterized protein n=2 Tax=Wuchereria bancrofti TaxID=6293 RepID=A0A3P7DUW1_WUCBA|nr:unnamed protein product [Wuchereria bancrofti]
MLRLEVSNAGPSICALSFSLGHGYSQIAIGLNSSEVSSTLIAGIATLLKGDDDPQKFMHTVDDIQRSMQCCGFAGNHTEWMQKRIIHYYDPIEDELKIMLDQARNI